MGIYTDFLANATTIDIESPRVGTDKAAYRGIQALQAIQGDRDYPAAYDAINEVQEISEHEAGTDAGTFEITINLFGGVTFTTAALDFDDDDAAIQAAIDTAADGVVDGYTAGDITVTGGPLTTDPVVLTFDGDSVASLNHPLAEVASIDLNDGGTPTDAGTVTVTTEGQTKRTAWAILNACGAIGGTIPVQGDAPTEITAASTRATNSYLPDQNTLCVLAHAAAVEDGNAEVETEILRVLGLS